MTSLSLLTALSLLACTDKPDTGDTGDTGDTNTTSVTETPADLMPEQCDGFGASQAWEIPTPLVYDYFMFSGDGLGSYWSLVDMNGDGIQDLVVHAVSNNAEADELADHWRVWLGTGTGFGQEIAWALPFDHREIDGMYTANAHYAAMDINGDGNLDLVYGLDPATGTIGGGAADPHWVVYPGDGVSGFATTPQAWSVPGEIYDSLHSSRSSGRVWTTMDLDGDGQIELVHTRSTETSNNWGYEDGNPHWKVFYRDGDGFSDTADEWRIPDSPTGYDGWFTSAVDSSNTLLDMNGDGLLDMVLPISTEWPYPVWGEGPDWYWVVHENTGAGFALDGVKWSIPSDYFVFPSSSLDWTYSTSYYHRTLKPGAGEIALVVATDPETDGPFIGDEGPQWAVFRRTDDGFADTHTPWLLPSEDFSYFYSTAGAAGLGWTTLDLNGDGCMDLMQTSGGDLGFPEAGEEAWTWRVWLGE